MKTLFIFILSLGAMQQSYAQNLAMVDNKQEINFEIIANSSKVVHVTYLEAVARIESNSIISKLQDKVSNYKIQSTPLFNDSEPANYHVVFKSGKNNLRVTYNNHGDILMSKETYYNVNIPFDLRVNIAKRYPQWELSKTKCSIIYHYNTGLNKTYAITLKNGSKTVKINDVASL